jgi:proteasome lid subunit RPN8/RPN11
VRVFPTSTRLRASQVDAGADLGRIDVNVSLPPATLSARLFNALTRHARETLPEECCGLLVGRAPGWFEELRRCRNDMTLLHRQDRTKYPRDGREAFHMNEADYLEVMTTAEAAGREVTAVYHSHADAGAYFSDLDREFASQPGFPFPEAQHIVISVLDGQAREAAIFRRISEPPGFEGRRLVVETA